jgi:hypothetical protein
LFLCRYIIGANSLIYASFVVLSGLLACRSFKIVIDF